jgi:hypothetical protein
MRPWSVSVIFTPLACCMAAMAFTQTAQTQLSDDEIKALLMQASKAAYSGTCPCPESRNAVGNPCGGTSAYSRRGAERPLCYPSDVTDAMIKSYRSSLARR